jgi:hypothetical protein
MSAMVGRPKCIVVHHSPKRCEYFALGLHAFRVWYRRKAFAGNVGGASRRRRRPIVARHPEDSASADQRCCASDLLDGDYVTGVALHFGDPPHDDRVIRVTISGGRIVVVDTVKKYGDLRVRSLI